MSVSMDTPDTAPKQIVYYPREIPKDWGTYAECRFLPPGTMSPHRGGNRNKRSPEELRLIGTFCANCCVQEECFDDALSSASDDGIRGGVTQAERKPLHEEFSRHKFVTLPEGFFEKTVEVELTKSPPEPQTKEVVKQEVKPSETTHTVKDKQSGPTSNNAVRPEVRRPKPRKVAKKIIKAAPTKAVVRHQKDKKPELAIPKTKQPVKSPPVPKTPSNLQSTFKPARQAKWRVGPAHNAILDYVRSQPDKRIDSTFTVAAQLLSKELGFSPTRIRDSLLYLKQTGQMERIKNIGKQVSLRLRNE